MARMDFTSLFYSQVFNRVDLIERLDSLLRTEYHTLAVIPYASEIPPTKCFRAYEKNRTFSCVSSKYGVSLFKLVFRSPLIERGIPQIEGKFFIYEYLIL